MQNTILSLAILLTSTCATGQSSLTWSRSLHASNCPVGLQADHAGLFAKRDVNDRDFGPGPQAKPQSNVLKQRIHLTITNFSLQDIVSAEVTAHGLSEKWRFVPVTAAPPVPDMTKQLEVMLQVQSNGHASHDLGLNHFATVTSIDVDAVTYADGSSWQATAPGTCSVTPSPLMLVSSAQ